MQYLQGIGSDGRATLISDQDNSKIGTKNIFGPAIGPPATHEDMQLLQIRMDANHDLLQAIRNSQIESLKVRVANQHVMRQMTWAIGVETVLLIVIASFLLIAVIPTVRQVKTNTEIFKRLQKRLD